MTDLLEMQTLCRSVYQTPWGAQTLAALKNHIDKTQNRETCDGTVDPGTWNQAFRLHDAVSEMQQANEALERHWSDPTCDRAKSTGTL